VNENEKLYGKLGARIIEGLQQAIAYERGENIDVRVTTVEVTARRKARLEQPPWFPPHTIQEIRQKLSVSQVIFAQMMGVSASTVRAWEQGKREPEGAARRLLQIADLHPEVLVETCGPLIGGDGERPLPRAIKAPATSEQRLAADTGSA
jgi:putative transcriptional regulator